MYGICFIMQSFPDHNSVHIYFCLLTMKIPFSSGSSLLALAQQFEVTSKTAKKIRGQMYHRGDDLIWKKKIYIYLAYTLNSSFFQVVHFFGEVG